MKLNLLKFTGLWFSMLGLLLSACNEDEPFTPVPVIDPVVEWRPGKGPDSNFPLNGLAVGESTMVYACGDSGYLYRSSDQGVNWHKQQLIQGYNFYDMVYQPSGLWMCGSNGLLMHTDTAFQVLDTIALGVSVDLYDVFFAGTSDAWMVGSPGINGKSTLLGSNNGGQTWQLVDCGSSEILRSVFAVNGSTWAVGMNGILVYSLDTGQTWMTDTLGNGAHLNKVFFIDSDTGFIAGNGGLLLRTTDRGQHWTTVSTFTLGGLNDVYFLNASEGWLCGDNGKIWHTTNGGLQWKVENTHTQGILKRIWFRNAQQGISVGADPANKALSVVYQLYTN